jgi:hypothetical protein
MTHNLRHVLPQYVARRFFCKTLQTLTYLEVTPIEKGIDDASGVGEDAAAFEDRKLHKVQ